MSDLGMGMSILTCLVLGILSRHFGWQLPKAEWSLPFFRPRPAGEGRDSQDEDAGQVRQRQESK